MARVYILSTADWDASLWTNKQHIAIRLARYGHDVVYINSLGLRRPALTKEDFGRIARRLVSSIRREPATMSASEDSTRPVRTVSPKVLPFHSIGVVRAINWIILRLYIRSAQTKSCILYTFSPLTYGIEKNFKASIYHSVDLLHELPMMPREVLLTSERKLLARVDIATASSRPVASHLKSMGGREIRYWPNVGDFELFSNARTAVRDKGVVFAGNLTTSKIRFDWLEGLLTKGFRLDVAGPVGIDGTDRSRVDRFLAHPGVTYHGRLSQPDLAKLLGRCTIGVIPYQINSYTTGVYPMKVAEYAAAGLFVVASDLPALAGESTPNVLAIAESSARFTDYILKNPGPPDAEAIAARSNYAASRSWTQRLSDVEDLLRTYEGEHQA